MDKRTVYIPEVIHTLTPSPNLHTCACTHGRCDHKDIAKCQEYTLLDPADLAKEVEDARIGRATIVLRDKWRDRIKSDEPTTRQEEAMWRELVATIAEAIAKAKEGEGCG